MAARNRSITLAIFGIAATPAFASGQVAGLGGTTFEITVVASGVATVECINPAGNRAPGHDTDVTVAGTTTPLPTPRNGQFRFNLESDDPNPLPSTPTCPNNQWTPIITDVAFTDTTRTLLDGARGKMSSPRPGSPVEATPATSPGHSTRQASSKGSSRSPDPKDPAC